MKIDKKIINYIIFGIVTTAVNVVTFYILDKLKVEYKINTTISNFISIIFAYVTNKIFVFESKDWEMKFVQTTVKWCQQNRCKMPVASLKSCQ